MRPEEVSIKECIYGRRTLRRYSEKVVSDEIVRDIIMAGLQAPSACNFQAWKFIVLDNVEKKAEFIAAYGTGPRGGRPMIENCSKGVLVTYRNDLGVSGRKLSDYIQSAAAAIQNMILYATACGVGCCWICDLPSVEETRKVFNIPENYDVVAFVSMGYPTEGKGTSTASQLYHYGSEENFRMHKRRYSFEQFVSYNEFVRVEGDSSYAKYPKYNAVSKLKEKYPSLYGFYQKLRKRVTPNSDT